MRKLVVFTIFIVGIILSISSCQRFEEPIPSMQSEYILFAAEPEISGTGTLESKVLENEITCDITDWDYIPEEDTRATLVTAIPDSIGVFGYNILDGGGTISNVLPLVMYNNKTTLSNGIFSPDSMVLWKNYNSGIIKFFAYSPYGSSFIKPSGKNVKGVPYIKYTNSTTSKEEVDILYAQTEEISVSNRNAVPLTFSHAMTAVNFQLGIDNATLTEIKLSGIKKSGTLSLDGNWTTDSGTASYAITKLTTTMLMVPQTLGENARITMKYNVNDVKDTISASIAGTEWQMGKRVVYTLKKKVPADSVEYVYFDFTAGSIVLDSLSYKGYVFVTNTDSTAVKVEVSGTIPEGGKHPKYYIYQSAPDSLVDADHIGNDLIRSSRTGYTSSADIGKKKPTLPKYTEIKVDGKSWSEYITDNTDPAEVLKKWNSFPENFLEPGTPHRILIHGDAYFDVTLDRVYSRYFPYRGAYEGDKFAGVQTAYSSAKEGSETYKELYGGITIGMNKLGTDEKSKQNTTWGEYKTFKEKVTLRLKGDNYFSRINYSKPNLKKYDGYLYITSEKGDNVSEGTLTVTLPYLRAAHPRTAGLLNLTRCGLIGGGSLSGTVENQSLYWRQVCGITFAGGTVYVGIEEINNSVWPVNENMFCTIGGINAYSNITISGGVLTAISYGSSPAIGGGAGWLNNGGNGTVSITGGTVYAHSFGVYNPELGAPVMSTAIGGGSSGNDTGNQGSVTISGGTVYAYSLGGCAIGGGTSAKMAGGKGSVTVKGTAQVYAKSIAGRIGTLDIDAGVAIGGGRSGTKEGDGGQATVTISGGTVVSGSIGGGKCGNDKGKLGRAVITVSGGKTTAQFLMVKDPNDTTLNTFSMSKGSIINSNTADKEYVREKADGGAVYIESGTCTISGGTISGCSAEHGGAIFMKGGVFNLKEDGQLKQCYSTVDGGAVYIQGGSANITGGQIINNIASKGNGGGIYITGGNFTMSGGKVSENSADTNPEFQDGKYYGGNGGGIYVTSDDSNPQITLSGGEISNNAADRNGGGLCVDMEGMGGYKASIVIGEEEVAKRDTLNPNIRLNKANLNGGGMAVYGKGSDITIYSGTVKGNVSAEVKNSDISNDGGTVDLVGKNDDPDNPQVNVRYNTIRFYANNGDDPEPFDEQRVITSTNSPLKPTEKALSFTKEFYHLSYWSTKRGDGGKTYKVDGSGAIMNITEDLDLYAHWVYNQKADDGD